METNKLSKEQEAEKKRKKIQDAKLILWERGELSYKLKGIQKEIYKAAKNFEDPQTVILASRQIGKSHTLLVVATETCIQNPGCIVKYATPTQNMIRQISKRTMRTILEDCPKHLRPIYNSQEKTWSFPNGSEIQLAGTDAGNAENLRGTTALLCIVDEAGFCDDLKYVVDSILFPTTTTTGGKIVMASTPNYYDPSHDFHEYYVKPAMADNTIIKFTIDQSPLIGEAEMRRILNKYPGGRENPQFKCEYLCELIADSSSFVVPEFHDKEKVIVRSDFDIPMAYDAYVSMDIGFKDLTVALFVIYDFKNSRALILDELVMHGPSMTTSALAKQLDAKEKETFKTRENYPIEPYMRVADNDLKLINDLHREHGLMFFATKKDNREAAINALRMWVAEERVIIHPRCKNLIYHLKLAQWNKARTDFLRLKDDIAAGVKGGHCDSIPALYYLIRNIQVHKKPEGFDPIVSYLDPRRNKHANLSDNAKTLLNMFKRKR